MQQHHERCVNWTVDQRVKPEARPGLDLNEVCHERVSHQSSSRKSIALLLALMAFGEKTRGVCRLAASVGIDHLKGVTPQSL